MTPESDSEGDSTAASADAASDEFARALVEFGEITRVYRVLPHERWAAQRFLRNVYSSHPAPSRITKKDGVIGCVGLGILYVWGFPSLILGVTGLGLLFASGGAYWANALIYVGVAGIFLTLLRAAPTFRASQRYLKSGDWRPAPVDVSSESVGHGPTSSQGEDSRRGAAMRPPPPSHPGVSGPGRDEP